MRNALVFVLLLGLASGCANTERRYSTEPLHVPPKLLTQTEPNYSEELRRQGISGVVVVEFDVDILGVPRNVHAIKSPHQELSKAAVAAVWAWRFEPGYKKGKPVNTRLQVPITFEIVGPK